MPWPSHKNPPLDHAATAAYNFVPLPEKVITAVSDAQDLPDHDTFADPQYPHTGYFDVTLETRSPLYVRCPFTLQEFLTQDSDEKRKADEKSPYRERIKNKAAFFYTQVPEEPVIPGSSLRGMLRALVEIAGYGKMSGVSNKNLVYRAVGDSGALGTWYREQTLGINHATGRDMDFDYPSPQLRGGYLRRQGASWAIQPAQEPGGFGESFAHVEYDDAWPIIGRPGQTVGRQITHKVYVQPARRVRKKRKSRGGGDFYLRLASTPSGGLTACNGAAPPGMVPAVLVESGDMSGKHMHCAIYEADPKAAWISISTEQWSAYVEDRDLTRDPKRTPRKLDKDQPLFYLLDKSNKLVFFGHTMMFRLPYERSIHDLIPAALRNPLEVDLAEAMFGFARQKGDFSKGMELPRQGSKQRAYAGRVSVGDAKLSKSLSPDKLWLAEGAITPSILSTPKATSSQHYLVQPKPEAMTDKRELSHYDSPKKDAGGLWRGAETVVRGHKLYPHQGNKDAAALCTQQFVPNESKQHTQFKPVQSGVRFTFRVHFENLSEIELGALCWALQPTGEEDETYCHKLGMGKALGMGAVQLSATLHFTPRVTPPGAQQPATSPQSRYQSLFSGNDWQTGDRMEPLDSYRTTFEKHVWQEVPTGRPFAGLRDLPRIAALLKMMEWPGLSPQQVATMGFKQFKEKRVLPDPIFVASRGTSSIEQSNVVAVNVPQQNQQWTPAQLPSHPVIKKEKITVLKAPSSKGNAQIRTQDKQEVLCSNVPRDAAPDEEGFAVGEARVTRQDNEFGKVTAAVWLRW